MYSYITYNKFGDKIWRISPDLIHNEHGPAFVYKGLMGEPFYYLNNIEMSFNVWRRKVLKKNEQAIV